MEYFIFALLVTLGLQNIVSTQLELKENFDRSKATNVKEIKVSKNTENQDIVEPFPLVES